MKKLFKKLFLYLFLLVFLGVIGAVASYMWFVVYFPGDAISQENIEKTLAMESPVLYSDNRTKIGVFFQEDHRQYVSYNRLPAAFVNALVAAEDRQFFRHYGVDLPGFVRAMSANIKARRVVQGGSTITQQAAKNLFKREGRTVKAKLAELLYALRLERHYSKEKILEFYANQFYVSGNGRGLGVAARYYFDKEPEELDLVESAFIAGSVKRPNYYNPFIKHDEEAAAQARENARLRTRYVLGQMYRVGMISSESYQQALNMDIPFNRGEMRFRLNTVMDLVKEGMDDPEVEEALQDYGIDNVATSGVRVVTTVDKDLQESNFFALQTELSRLDVRLLGYDRKKLQKHYEALNFGADSLSVGQFLVGRILDIRKESPVRIEIEYSQNANKNSKPGIIDEQGIMHLLSSLVPYSGQRWSLASSKDFPLLFKELQSGDLVYLSVREIGAFGGDIYFNLEKYPDLQGASLVMQKGNILAMAGGMDNYFYNRAISAKRPMGSTVKPLLYAAAIQLGWNNLDSLRNERAMFVYQNAPYIPRPDHKSPHQLVSMSWAGVHSENVASVWLLYHLCDRLSPADFKELLAHVDMAREDGESYSHYKRRIRDGMGIVVDSEALQQTAFEQAVARSEADLIFAGRQEDFQNLGYFYFSDSFEEMIEKEIAEKDEKKLTPQERQENEVRQKVSKMNFIRFKRIKDQLLAGASFPGNIHEGYFPFLYAEAPGETENMWWTSSSLKADGRFLYTEEDPGKGWLSVRISELQKLLAPMTVEQRQDFWGRVSLENLLTLDTLNLVEENFLNEYDKLKSLPAYDEDVLHLVHDFRVLAGLRYLIELCRQMGVTSSLEPVLSFPLGSNVISLYELAHIYEALTSGIYYSKGGRDNPGLALIDRIESANGDIIYDGSIEEKQVFDPQTALAVSDILRNVVKFGTGRYAKDNILLHSSNPEIAEQLAQLDLAVPVLGKTGTANSFTNSTFVGVVPGLQEKGSGVILKPESYTLASYVGFDDNRPMTRTSTHITGSSGALPVWTKVAKSIILEKDYAGSMDIVDMVFSGSKEVPLFYPDLGQIEVSVAVRGGGVALSSFAANVEKAPVTTFGKVLAGGVVEPQRYFRPYWKLQ